ncbi:MAG TPA: ABC transporter permease [Terriglobales bacterium]|nr:ABC transporter permease [Terriglobales bacterium]
MVAILNLALGIGASVAMFSVVYGALLQPLSYPQPAELISVHETIPEFAARYPLIPVETGAYSAWRERATTLAGLALFEPTALDLTGRGEPQHLHAEQVSASMFSVLGVRPRLGRGFVPSDDQPGHVHVVVLSDALWRSEFHADPGILGQALDLNGQPNQVVGVMAPGFRFPFAEELGPIIGSDPEAAAPPQLFQPAGVDLARNHFENWNYGVFARLRPGVAAAQAQAELQVLTTAALHADKASIPHIGVVVTRSATKLPGVTRWDFGFCSGRSAPSC